MLLGELPDAWPNDVKKQFLDVRTKLGFSPFMIACKLGFTAIAELLTAKGCRCSLMNWMDACVMTTRAL